MPGFTRALRLAGLLIAAAALGGLPVAHADLSGDPVGAAEYWGRQRYDDCTMMAVADVVGEITGTKPAEDDVIALASATPNGDGSGPIYALPSDAAEGSAARKMQLPNISELPVLLAHYGVGSLYTNDIVAAGGGPPTGIPAMQIDLGAGRKVIASVNGETIWNTAGDRTVHDHALVVTGVDTGTGMVHLNDSANPHPDSQVSIETFEAAWRTSDHAMVIAG